MTDTSSTPDRVPRDRAGDCKLSTIERLRKSYGDKEVADRTDSWVSRFIYRPISFPLTVPFAWMGWSGNQVTLLRACLALLSTVFVAIGNHLLVVGGGSMYALCVILDYVDGNLARLQSTANGLGALLEELADQIGPSLFPLGIGVGLYFRPDRVLRSLGAAHPVGALMAGAITSMSYCLSVIALLYTRLIPIEARKGQSATIRPSRPAGEAAVLRKGIYVAKDLVNEGLYLAIVFGVILAATFDVMSIYLAARAIRNMVLLMISVWGLAGRVLAVRASARD